MADPPKTLAQFFAEDAASFSAQDANPDVETAVRKELEAADPGVLKAFTMGAILGVLYNALDVGFADILRAGWESMRDLQEYRDPKKHPPDQTNWVAFGKHKLTSSHEPKVEVLVDGKRATSITFKVDLSLKIASSNFRIQAGRIHEATGAVFEGECKLSYQGFTLLKRQIPKFTVPGGIKFEGGIPIVPLPT